MAGAVDLSALKKSSDADAGPQSGAEITEANFEAEVLDKSNRLPIVVVLWSPRSDASVQLIDDFASLAAADAGKWSLATVNLDASPRLAQALGVQAVPTVLAALAGQLLQGPPGMQSPQHLRQFIDQLLSATAGKLSGAADSAPEEVDPGLAKARELLDAGNFDAALGAYRAILDTDPGHPEAKAVIRQLEFQLRAAKHRPDATRAADAAPDDIDAAFAAADVELRSQQLEAAFNRLIDLIRRTTGDDKTKVRTRLIELFELFDPADPAVIAGRRNLANALY